MGGDLPRSVGGAVPFVTGWELGSGQFFLSTRRPTTTPPHLPTDSALRTGFRFDPRSKQRCIFQQGSPPPRELSRSSPRHQNMQNRKA
jgi:hypothetical protein